MIERLFHLSEQGSSVRTEVVAGLTTFMTMAYIIAVNPLVLAGTPDRPGPLGPALLPATVAATCLAAAVPTLLMGVWANYPLALASGMGLNLALATAAIGPTGIPWPTMMGVVVVEGLIIAVLVATNLRAAVMRAIPADLKRAIGAGIGLFIALLGLHNAHWMGTSAVEKGPLALPPVGTFHSAPTLLATFGILVTAWLVARRVRGALLVGIVATTALAMATGHAPLPAAAVAIPSFETFGRADILGALKPALLAVVFAFLITDFFDTMGTVIAVGEQSGHVKPDGSMPRLNRVLMTDSLAAAWGGLCSASSVTTYIESSAGVSEGGRTGLSSVVVGALFLASMFLSPVVQAIPPEATAAALIIVGFMMLRVLQDIDLRDVTAALPAFLTLVVIPLTSSISRGIGTGFIAYVLLMALTGRARQVSPVLWALAALFALSFGLEPPPAR